MTNSDFRKTILFLAANPKDTPPVRLDEEIREIDAGLRRANNRHAFSLEQRWAVRPKDLRQALLDLKPQIVHFSGHGTTTGRIVLENTDGESSPVEPGALSELFALFDGKIECVILNACYSVVQAEAIARNIDFVVGMTQEIGDKAAIEFAIGFYDALGAGESIESAYRFGCNAIRLEGISEYLIPVLKRKIDFGSVPTIIQKTERTKRWVVVISATLEEVNKAKAEALVDHLRQLSGDAYITLLEIKSGSVRIVLKSSDSGFTSIKSLFDTGVLGNILGFKIKEIHEEHQAADIIIIRLSGRLTEKAQIDELTNQVKDLLDNDYKRILLDLGDVTYVNSMGIGALVSCLTLAKNTGGDLKFLNLTKKIDALLSFKSLIKAFIDPSAIVAFMSQDEV